MANINYIARIRNKKIHRFHLKIVEDHIAELKKKCTTIVPNGFIRELIYQRLSALNIKYKLQTVGFRPVRDLCRYRKRSMNWTSNMIFGYISQGMIIKEEMLKNYQSKDYEDYFQEDDIHKLFENAISKETKLEIVDKMTDGYKFTIFDRCHLHRPIKSITIVNDVKTTESKQTELALANV